MNTSNPQASFALDYDAILHTMSEISDLMPDRLNNISGMGEKFREFAKVAAIDKIIYFERIDSNRHPNVANDSAFVAYQIYENVPFDNIPNLLTNDEFYHLEETLIEASKNSTITLAKENLSFQEKIQKMLPEYFLPITFAYNGTILGMMIFGRNTDFIFSSLAVKLYSMFARSLGDIVYRHFEKYRKLYDCIDFEEMMNLSSNGLLVAENNKFIEATPRFQEIFEYSDAKQYFKNPLPEWGIVDIEEAKKHFVIHEDGQFKFYETTKWVYVQSGKKKFLIIRYYEFRYHSFVRQYIVARDKTEERQLEMKLKEEADRYLVIANMCTDYSYSFEVLPNRMLRFDWGTESFDVMFEVNDKKNLCRTIWGRHILPKHKHLLQEKMDNLLANKNDIHEYVVVDHNGIEHWIRDYTVAIFDKYLNRVTKIVGGSIDISARKKDEFMLRRTKDELSELNKSKDKFISILGHDLKNPIVGMKNLLDLLYEDIDNIERDEAKEIIMACRTTSNDVHKLFEDLMRWAKSRIGNAAAVKINSSVRALVDEVKIYVRGNLQSKNIELINQIPAGLMLKIDPDMIKMVFRNLITNAFKFSFEDSKIIISSRENTFDDGSPAIEFEVKDFGTGIKPENLAKLFKIDQKFTATGTRDEKGTGMGLILCKEYVDKHNGKIWAESEYQKGSSFKFLLPK